MASRGWESTGLHVDTAHEPDAAISHGDVEHVDQDEVLQKAIVTAGADIAAHEVRRQEEAFTRQTNALRLSWPTALHDARTQEPTPEI